MFSSRRPIDCPCCCLEPTPHNSVCSPPLHWHDRRCCSRLHTLDFGGFGEEEFGDGDEFGGGGGDEDFGCVSIIPPLVDQWAPNSSANCTHHGHTHTSTPVLANLSSSPRGLSSVRVYSFTSSSVRSAARAHSYEMGVNVTDAQETCCVFLAC